MYESIGALLTGRIYRGVYDFCKTHPRVSVVVRMDGDAAPGWVASAMVGSVDVSTLMGMFDLRVVEALREQGWDVPDQQANFVWFALGDDTAAFAAACQEAGLTVRPYGSDGARATIAEREANDRLVEVAGAFLAARGSR